MPDNAAPAAGGDKPQQAPMGVSSVTGPTPNKGYEAAVQQKLGHIVNMLYEMLPIANASTPIGKSIMKMIEAGSAHVQPGASTAASERNNIQRMMQQNAQNVQSQQQMRPPQAGGQMPPGGPPMASGGGVGMTA